jgi:hypothetical protein
MNDAQLRTAFLLGFMVSREGYNGECAFGHAPRGLEATGIYGIQYRLDEFAEYPELSSLADQAMAWIAQHQPATPPHADDSLLQP